MYYAGGQSRIDISCLLWNRSYWKAGSGQRSPRLQVAAQTWHIAELHVTDLSDSEMLKLVDWQAFDATASRLRSLDCVRWTFKERREQDVFVTDVVLNSMPELLSMHMIIVASQRKEYTRM